MSENSVKTQRSEVGAKQNKNISPEVRATTKNRQIGYGAPQLVGSRST